MLPKNDDLPNITQESGSVIQNNDKLGKDHNISRHPMKSREHIKILKRKHGNGITEEELKSIYEHIEQETANSFKKTDTTADQPIELPIDPPTIRQTFESEFVQQSYNPSIKTNNQSEKQLLLNQL